MGALDQYVHTVGAYRADEEGGEQAEEETGALEGNGHRQDTRAQATLEQMDEGVHVAGRMGQLTVLERIVEGRLLVVRPLDQRQRRAIRKRDRHLIFLALVSAMQRQLVRAILPRTRRIVYSLFTYSSVPPFFPICNILYYYHRLAIDMYVSA